MLILKTLNIKKCISLIPVLFLRQGELCNTKMMPLSPRTGVIICLSSLNHPLEDIKNTEKHLRILTLT